MTQAKNNMAASDSNLLENCAEMAENYSTKMKRTAGEPLDPSTAGDPVESNGIAADHAVKRSRASGLAHGGSDTTHTSGLDGASGFTANHSRANDSLMV